jgi:pimeloyl-ACP methyl ester carboxylesterase
VRGAPPAKRAWPRATSLEDITAQVGAIDVPTVVIAVNWTASMAPHSCKQNCCPAFRRPHVLPGTGHLSMLESPDALVPLIEQFCGSFSGSAR